METVKKSLFISDLHLEERSPVITQLFYQFLKQCDESVDALYILGDLFEAWIGDDDDAPYSLAIKQALRAATDKGLRIYFMAGNRDFLVGHRFFQETGCKLLGDEEIIFLYGTPVLLMHGDTLCTRDTEYLKWRKIARNRFIRWVFTSIPLSLRKKMARKIRAASQEHVQSTAKEIMDVTQEEVERVMNKHNVRYLIHGHTHRPGIHEFNHAKTRIVLGAWHEVGSVFNWDEDGNKKLVVIPAKAGIHPT